MGQPAVKTQPCERRIKNFHEVSLGYPKKLALQEAGRCPQCTDPVCMRGCPLGIDIPGFIRFLREGRVAQAYTKIREKNFLPSVCGRICTAPCEAACVLTDENAPIGIRALERYASDFGRPKIFRGAQKPNAGKRIAIVGSGPAGLAAAAGLALLGYEVSVFESFDKPGGVLRYGIPAFRLPDKIFDQEIQEIKSLGVKIETNYFISHTASLEELKSQGFAAILLATGAGVPKFMDLPGTHFGGVYYGEEFLMRVNRAKDALPSGRIAKLPLGQNVAVIGSGNTALDCARSAVRLGRKVSLVFRGTEEDMRVSPLERDYAKSEGIFFEPMVRPVEILAGPDHFVRGLKCMRMDFADAKGSGQWQLIPVPDSEFVLDAETVIIAIGHIPNSLISRETPNLKINKDGTVKIDPKSGMTSVKGIFAAGNVMTNAGPVVEAIASGQKAVRAIDRYLADVVTIHDEV